MAKCEFCDKGVVFGIRVSHSHRRSNRPWKPNVKRVKAIVNGTPKQRGARPLHRSGPPRREGVPERKALGGRREGLDSARRPRSPGG